jgi:hypothetical protein
MRPFNGETFVAFIDISGFKAMMADGERGALALEAFYSVGYRVLGQQHQNQNQIVVDGIFVSDCGILFVHNAEEPPLARLNALCSIVKQIHKQVYKKAVQLTTSIAWGEFTYTERIEFPGIGKNLIYGNAYMDAFADNDSSPKKLYSGECRIKRTNLPPDVSNALQARHGHIGTHSRETPHHFYYEWMRES